MRHRSTVAVAGVLCVVLVCVLYGQRDVRRAAGSDLASELLEASLPPSNAQENWNGEIKQVQSQYEDKIATLRADVSAKMKQEEQHMLAEMEDERANEQKTIEGLRSEEERKETVILARKKAEAIEAAVLGVQEEENKKLVVLRAKLSALHHLASQLDDTKEKKDTEEEREAKAEAAAAASAKAKQTEAEEAAAKAAEAARERAAEAEKKQKLEMAKKLQEEVKRLESEREQVEGKVHSLQDEISHHAEAPRVPPKPTPDAVDNEVIEGLQHAEKKGGTRCTDKDCPLNLEEEALVSNDKVIHTVSKIAADGHGDSKEKAIEFVKSLQSRINKDFHHVMGFGMKTIDDAEHVFSQAPSKTQEQSEERR